MPSSPPAAELEVGQHVVRITNPDRVYFPDHGWTKLDVANYYLAVGEGIVRAPCGTGRRCCIASPPA